MRCDGRARVLGKACLRTPYCTGGARPRRVIPASNPNIGTATSCAARQQQWPVAVAYFIQKKCAQAGAGEVAVVPLSLHGQGAEQSLGSVPCALLGMDRKLKAGHKMTP